MGLFDRLLRPKTPAAPATVQNANRLDEYVLKQIANIAVYPDWSSDRYIKGYTDNGDVFTVINKITEPASRIPILQFDKNGNEVPNGRMISLLRNPNPYMTQSEYIEAVMTFFLLTGNGMAAYETVEHGMNAGLPIRIDPLPPQWMRMQIGDYYDPIAGWSFLFSGNVIDYSIDQVMHWKEFNPDYDRNGTGHLMGMSRLKPIFKSIIGSDSAYDALVASFQHLGAFGILTILGPEGSTQEVGKPVLSKIKQQIQEDYSGAKNFGKIVATSKDHKWTNFGLTNRELMIIQALGSFGGKVYDAYNVPDILMSGSQSKTYMNFKEGKQALWSDAIMPNLDACLEKHTKWLSLACREEGHYLQADYSGIEVLQKNKTEMVAWMVNAKAFSKNEIREALGYDRSDLPGMDDIFDSAGIMPVGSLGQMPEAELTEDVLKALKIKDYRHAIN